MKKSEIARQFDYKATVFLITAVIALALNSILNSIVNSFDSNAVFEGILAVLVALFAIFADIMTVKGFLVVNKSCKLSEQNQNYYMGKKLTILSVVCIVAGFILSIVAIFFTLMLEQYNQGTVLTADEETARMNMMIITSVVNIALQLLAISTPYIIYIWQLRKSMKKEDKLNNFALITVIVLILQLAIGILNSIYIVKGAYSTFLSSFSEILLTVKYLVLALFLFARRQSLIKSVELNEEK